MEHRQNWSRRRVMQACAGFAAMTRAGQVRGAASDDAIDLWPGPPPGGPAPSLIEQRSSRGALTGITRPRLVAYPPVRPAGTAVVVMSGGGYARIESGHEGEPACRWLAAQGVLAFELLYRLPGDGWPPAAPFQDAQRALRLLRSRAGALGIAHLGVLGFSAGGHLAGMTAVRPGAALYPGVDAADTLSARPDFAGLLYPVISMVPPLDTTRSRREILGRDPSLQAAAAMSVQTHVTAEAPPCFLVQATDDPIAKVENSLLMESALRQAGVPAELHVFETGGHGWGMGAAGTEPAAWPALFAAWMVTNGVLPRPQPT